MHKCIQSGSYSGDTGGAGGSTAWDGAIGLRWIQLVVVAWMSLVIPGQKIDAG